MCYDFASIFGRNKFILELSKARPGATNKIVEPSCPVASDTAKPTTRSATMETSKTAPSAEVEYATEEVFAPTEEIVTPEETSVVTEEEVVVPEEKVNIKPATVEAKPKKAAHLKTKAAMKARSVKTAGVAIPRKLPLKGKLIVVDPGHGGIDPGYIGRSGILEKNLNLLIALKLKNILNNAGAKVVMTRATDRTVRNKDVVALANGTKADLFVAIHLNSFVDPRISGCETYYFTPKSRKFAVVMERTLSRTIKRKSRGVKRETYYAVHHTTMPAVLVEPVYLTNRLEEMLVLNPQYQTAIANGIFKGITDYVKMGSSWQRSHK